MPKPGTLFYNRRVSEGQEKLKTSDYVHLHNHTQYSLLDGLTKVPLLMDYVKSMGMEAVAMTDHGTMSGAIEFYKAGLDAGVKPIIGMEAYISSRRHTDKDPSKDRQYYHLTVLAMNNEGYQNLMQLSTIANLDGFYYRPRIDRELVEKYNQGLIALSGCIGGEVSDALRQGQYDSAKKIAKWYKKVFGDRYYIELQDHGHPGHPTAWEEQNAVNRQLLKLADELGIEPIVTCDAHYLKKEDQEAHEVLLCVQTGSFLSDQDRFSLKAFELHVADPSEIINRWGKENPELITNTKKIAQRCDLNIDIGKIIIPTYPTPKSETEKSLLEKISWRGLAWRYGGFSRRKSFTLSISDAKKSLTKEIISRAKQELDVIDKVGYNGFFLIVNDFVNWGKDQGIVFGPGRGSTAGSIIAYALRLTELDPLKYNLLFERFLTADRISPPDMDIDIQDTRRDEVINYCIEKYGREKVANIVTFGRMAARNSVRDVARVLQVPYAQADRLAKMIPPPYQGRHTPLAIHLMEVPELKVENEQNPQSSRVFDLAVKLEGTIRSHGVHAAGVVITPKELVKYVPLEMAQKGVVATQYSMGPIEDLGLLKIDFLGLSNLTIIKNTIRIIKKVYAADIDLDNLSLDDQNTYRLLQQGATTGVFQLESAGMKRYLKELKPTVFDDIIAMVALYRPGPMQWIEEFIARKHGRRKIEYMHPVMKSALENTYGIIVYQEQVMQISKDLSGFSGSQADTLRKGIGKKIPEVLAKMKKEFINGAVKHSGADKRLMETFWTQLEDFAAYAFNKSHAACYGLIAYQTAYLKANYPSAFMAALMTSDHGNTDRLAIEIAECRKMGLEVLPPDVNESFHEFAVVPGSNQIRFGLDAIKNVGQGAVEEIISAREGLGGRFDSIEEFCRTVNCHIVNRKTLESLIKAGALDRFAERSRLLNNLDNIVSLASRIQKDASSGQVDLFGDHVTGLNLMPQLVWDDSLPVVDLAEQLKWERELLGIYLSNHPLERYRLLIEETTIPLAEIAAAGEGVVFEIGGLVTGVREITTKNGSKMAFAQIADFTSETEVVIFPKIYEQSNSIWQKDNVVTIKGKLNGRGNGGNQELKFIVDEAHIIDAETAASYAPSGKKMSFQVRKKKVAGSEVKISSGRSIDQRLYIRLEDSSNQPLLLTLKEKLDVHRGETEVVLVTGAKTQKQIIRLPQTISINEESLRDLADTFGSMNVVVR